MANRVTIVMGEQKKYFGDGSVWEKIDENSSEIQAQNVNNSDWTEWVSKADWNDSDIYQEVN